MQEVQSARMEDDGEKENAILLEEYRVSSDSQSSQQEPAIFLDTDLPAPIPRWRIMVSIITQSLYQQSYHYLINTLVFLIPSFIYTFRTNPTAEKKPLHPTAYLDGLRGVASLFVAFSHYECQFAPAILEGWGTEHDNYWFLQLPLLRIVHSGNFMVNVFYVLSGFVLSSRGLKLARQGRQSEFCRSMASSVFRRWLRLMLPPMASMFVAMLIGRMGLWKLFLGDWLLLAEATDNPVAQALPPTQRFQWPSFDFAMIGKQETWSIQLWDLFWAMLALADPFRYGAPLGPEKPYNAGVVMWTIPAEWLGSIVVFIVTVGVAWLRTWAKLSTLLMIAAWSQYTGKWELGQFVSGILLAELTLIREARSQRRAAHGTDMDLPGGWEKCHESWTSRYLALLPESLRCSPERLQHFTQVGGFAIATLAFVAGAYLGSTPPLKQSRSPGYAGIWAYTASAGWASEDLHLRFVLSLGSILIVLSLNHCRALQGIFTTRLAQYLGRVSFALYLCHCQVLWTVSTRVFPWCMALVGGGSGQLSYLLGMTLGGLICFPITFWVADVFCRAVDEKSVKLARWVGDRLLVFPEAS